MSTAAISNGSPILPVSTASRCSRRTASSSCSLRTGTRRRRAKPTSMSLAGRMLRWSPRSAGRRTATRRTSPGSPTTPATDAASALPASKRRRSFWKSASAPSVSNRRETTAPTARSSTSRSRSPPARRLRWRSTAPRRLESSSSPSPSRRVEKRAVRSCLPAMASWPRTSGRTTTPGSMPRARSSSCVASCRPETSSRTPTSAATQTCATRPSPPASTAPWRCSSLTFRRRWPERRCQMKPLYRSLSLKRPETPGFSSRP